MGFAVVRVQVFGDTVESQQSGFTPFFLPLSQKRKRMGKFFIVVFAIVFETLRNLVVLGIAIVFGMLISSFLCQIEAQESYSWISGIWHGLFVIPNYLRHLMDSDVLYKASIHTTMYNGFWWFLTIVEIISLIPVVIRCLISPVVAAIAVSDDY